MEFFFSSLVEWGLVCRRHKIIKVTWFKKVMEKRFVWLFVFVFAIGLVCAAGDWGDINSDRDSGIENDTVDVVNDTEDENDTVNVVNDTGDESEPRGIADNYDYTTPDYSSDKGDGKYTFNFYIAIALGVIFILLVAYFAYLFLRKPKNKWKNKK